MKLEGRVAIVTGGAGGIGEARALLFAEEGAVVAVVDLEESAAASTSRKIAQQGGSAIAIGADVTSPADVNRIVQATIERLGAPTILLNNAGVDLEGR